MHFLEFDDALEIHLLHDIDFVNETLPAAMLGNHEILIEGLNRVLRVVFLIGCQVHPSKRPLSNDLNHLVVFVEGALDALLFQDLK